MLFALKVKSPNITLHLSNGHIYVNWIHGGHNFCASFPRSVNFSLYGRRKFLSGFFFLFFGRLVFFENIYNAALKLS